MHQDAAVVDWGLADSQARATEEGDWDSDVGRLDDGEGRGEADMEAEAMNDHRGHESSVGHEEEDDALDAEGPNKPGVEVASRPLEWHP